MDEGLQHDRTAHVMKTGEDRLAGRRDSGASDTESLAQERERQHINTFTPSEKKNGETSLQGGEGEEEEEEDLHIYDSLERAAFHTEYLETQREERQRGCPPPSGDDYSDLRYDPNWRTNLRGAARFDQSPQASVEELHQKVRQTGSREPPLLRGGYRFVPDACPGRARLTAEHSEHSYHLHPQTAATSGSTQPPSGGPARNEPGSTWPSAFRGKHEDGERSGGNAELSEDLRNMQIQQHSRQQEGRHAHRAAGQTKQRKSSPRNKKKGGLMEDVVERNKMTLGRHVASSGGSYLKTHTQEQERRPHNGSKVHTNPEGTNSTRAQEDISAAQRSVLPTAQQVAQISRRTRAQQREQPHPPPQQPPPVSGVAAEQGDSLRFPLTKPATEPQKTRPSQRLAPAIHLNIHLNAPAHLLPLLQQTSQDAIINLASLHGHSLWHSALRPPLPPGYQPTNQGMPTHMSPQGLNVAHQKSEHSQELWQRAASFGRQFSCEELDQRWSPTGAHTEPSTQPPLRTPAAASSSQGSGSFPVLPPITGPRRGSRPEPCRGQSVQRSSSDGYLVQMDRQKQRRARATYKAYSLKEYQQLQSHLNLQGPDCTVPENTKMKRQTLYSKGIREQNKKISRIPCAATKEPDGKDKKVPRLKALEYAKTIAKPCVPRQREGPPSAGLAAPHTTGLDESQLETLELLRKRHEEEKQAVARFRKVQEV